MSWRARMRSGPMRHKLTIQTVSVTRDGMGSKSESWSDGDAVWAAIQPLRGDELLRAQAVNADVTHKITMREGSGVTVKDRLKYGSRYFHIVSVLDVDERGRKHELLCTEAV